MKVKVVGPWQISHDGTNYVDGDEVELDDHEARRVIRNGWAEPVDSAPNVSDPKADWVEYAEAQGVDVEDMTKQQIIDAVEQ